MTQLLVLREHIIKFYQRFALFLNPLFRFIIGFITFSSINQMIGYHPVLNEAYTEVLLALLSILMPGSVFLFAAAVFVVVHIFYVSNMLALVVSVILFIFYFAYIKFVPASCLCNCSSSDSIFFESCLWDPDFAGAVYDTCGCYPNHLRRGSLLFTTGGDFCSQYICRYQYESVPCPAAAVF